MPRMIRFVVCVALALSIGAASSACAQAPENVAGAEPGLADLSVKALLRLLDAPRYEKRMDATRELVVRGEEVVAPLEQLLSTAPGLEVQTRAFEVLTTLARRETQFEGGPAFQAIQRLGASQRNTIARRAMAKLEQLAEYRRDLAYEMLSSKGAVLSKGWVQPAFGSPVVHGIEEIEIGRHWRGTEKDIQWLRYIGPTKRVTFDGKHATNEYIKPLAELRSIGTVTIKRATVDDDAIETLTMLERCNVVEIYHTPITDASVEQIARIPAHMVKLYGTKISEAGRAALQKALPPSCLLDFRAGGGFLGIGPNEPVNQLPNERGGFVIGNVEPNSSAMRAGLRQGDRILAYDGTPVGNFEEIRQLISRNAPGDEVKVEFLRAGKKMAAEITLGEWP